MKKYLFTLANIFTVITLSVGQWVSPGNGTSYNISELAGNSNGCVIMESNGQITVTSDLTISANDVLVIDYVENGIAIEDGKQITIKGSFVCEAHDYPVVMTGNNSFGTQDGYFKMRFENAVDNLMNNMKIDHCGGIQFISSAVTIDNCEFYNFNTSSISSVINYFECNPIIKNSYFHDNEGAAISSGANIMGSPKILNNRFYNNVTANDNYPQINLGPGAEDTIYIVGNHIEGVASDMSGGIAIADLMGVGSTKALVSGNTVINNRYGYTQTGATISTIIRDNIFKDNNLETNPNNGGSGISIYGSTVNNAAIIRNNIITGNLWGITAIYYNTIDLGTENDFGNNVLYGNGNGGVTYELYNNSYNDISAIGNYWGSNDEDYPETVIFHQPDQAGLGLVTFAPAKQLFPNILSFSFLKENNPGITRDYFGEIDLENHKVTVNYGEEIGASSLVADYQTDLGVSCDLESGVAHDYSDPVLVTLETPHGTTQEWIINVTVCTNIIEDEAVKVDFYPNPVIDNLTISSEEELAVSIFNAAGQTLYAGVCEEGHADIDVTRLREGIYFVKFTDKEGKTAVRKFVKMQ